VGEGEGDLSISFFFDQRVH